jgi:hypothetical protein
LIGGCVERFDSARPVAQVDIVVHCDGWSEVAVLRPEADAVIDDRVHVGSAAAVGALLDRSVELITWNRVPRDDGGTAAGVRRQSAVDAPGRARG